jgi:tetratricopeptide (TPR) repeat protein
MFRIRLWRATIVFAFVLIGLLFLTAWNVTGSVALEKARHAHTRGDLAGCLKHALDHLDRRPWSREAALWAALSLSRLDYASEAESYYRRVGHLRQSDLQTRAYGLARGPHPERAIPAYHEILSRWPKNVTALRRLAALELAQNHTEALLELAERLNRIPDGAVIGSTLRGVAYHNDKNPHQAAIAFERVLELDPELREMPLDRSLFWSHLAEDLVASGRIDDAGRYLTKALADAPDAHLMNRLGRAYFLQGALDKAEHYFRRAMECDPTDYSAYLNLGELALQRQEREEALKHLNLARALVPQHYGVLYNLASVYRQLGRSADADRIQKTLEQLRGNSSSTAGLTNGPWPRYAL